MIVLFLVSTLYADRKDSLVVLKRELNKTIDQYSANPGSALSLSEITKMKLDREMLKRNINAGINQDLASGIEIVPVYNSTQFEVLSFFLYDYSLTSNRVIINLRNKTNNFYDFVKISFILIKNNEVVSTDFTYIDYATYGSTGMAPYSQSFCESFVDNVDYDEIQLTFECTLTSSRDLLFDQMFEVSNFGIDLSEHEWFGDLTNLTGNSVEFASVYLCYYKNGKMTDFNLTFMDYKNPPNVRFSYATDSPDESEKIVLWNYKSTAVNLGGWTLGNKEKPNAYVIPPVTWVDANRTITFTHDQLNFSIADDDEILYLKDNTGTLIDIYSDDTHFLFGPNESWHFDGYVDDELEYDYYKTYVSYSTSTLNGTDNINPNIPIFSKTSYEGDKNQPLAFSAFLADYNGNALKWMIDWGNGTQSSWASAAGSKSVSTINYSYPTAGVYYIRARTTDQVASLFKPGAESGWSDSIRVTIHEVYDPLSIVNDYLSPGQVNVSYNDTLLAIGGLSPYTWSVISGALPLNLSIDAATGLINGTPKVSGNFQFRVRCNDSRATATIVEKEFILSIVESPLRITDSELVNGVNGSEYLDTVKAEGGIKPYHWTVSGGVLPSGLVLDGSKGIISGI
ncbi:MAG: putative Ig domain-containing protein, partial [Candidatus Delongbacteria bacterium]|nr:putative Ig domain-containing protein [Candidatus Delongbacteria bacterium]